MSSYPDADPYGSPQDGYFDECNCAQALALKIEVAKLRANAMKPDEEQKF
jgi:hypothetical protein